MTKIVAKTLQVEKIHYLCKLGLHTVATHYILTVYKFFEGDLQVTTPVAPKQKGNTTEKADNHQRLLNTLNDKLMADSNFIDYVKIFCASGHGGPGSVHLHRAKYVPKGGPDGGDGGRGGHIILRANPQFWTLIHLKYKKFVKAENGEHGGAALCKGKQGQDIILTFLWARS